MMRLLQRFFRFLRQNRSGIIRFLLLLVIGTAILLPLLALIASSGKDLYGLIDPLVKWVPREFHFRNYKLAFSTMGGLPTLLNSLKLYLSTALVQVLSSAVIAYGFARYGFRGRGILFAAMIFTFFMPQQVLMLPRYVLCAEYDILATEWTLLLPAAFGQGMKQTVLILIFWQFMRTIPVSLEEAAMIDGCSLPGIFLRIGIPLAAPGFVINSVLAFAWNWNDAFFADVYFKGKINTMTLALANIKAYYNSQGLAGASFEADQVIHAGVEAAAAIMVIAVPLLLFLLLEKRLIESVDRAGITGE